MNALAPAIVVVTCASLLACGPPTEHTSWREEVELSGGRVITVERTVTWQDVTPWGQSKSYLTRSLTIEILTESGRAAAPIWRAERERVLLLDWDSSNREYILVTYPANCSRYREAGRPQPPYIQYRLRNGEWTQVPFEAELVGRRANMLVHPRVSQELEFLTVSQKEELQGGATGQTGQLVAEGRPPGCG
ncbi:MAG: hypothetical protein IRZ28_06915 [Steroidobacteraceae bacterium]|nr:hypothetical protein [Steroidobacteraceae bacterium]